MLLSATIRHVRRAVWEVKAFEVEGDLRPAARAALTQTLETTLEGEVTAAVAAERYARVDSRRDDRCGAYRRHLACGDPGAGHRLVLAVRAAVSRPLPESRGLSGAGSG